MKKKVEMKQEAEDKKAACRSFEGTKLEGTKKQDDSGHLVLLVVALMKLLSLFDETHPSRVIFQEHLFLIGQMKEEARKKKGVKV